MTRASKTLSAVIAISMLMAGSTIDAQDNVFARSPLQNVLDEAAEQRKWRMLAVQHFGTFMLTYEQEILLVALHFQVPANLLQAIAEREATDEGAIRTVRSIGERLARPLRAGMRTIEALAQVTNFPPEVIQQIVARGNEIYHGEQPPPARTGEIELRRAPNGHFFARVAVNGIPMLMMVDTGASRVSLTAADAEAAGILSPTDFTVPIQTANGITYAAEVVLDALYVEGRRLGPTAAFVLPSGGDSLLGNSALIQLGRMEVDGDRLRIEAR